jgi:uncharacterized protein (TIGR03067 family)
MARKLLGLAAVLALAGAARPDDAGKADLDRLQGGWVMESARRDGKDVEPNMTRVVKGDAYEVRQGDKVVAKGTIKLDASKSPKEIDVTRADGQRMKGIYEIKEDVQRVCLAPPGKDRPTQFKAEAGGGLTLTVWKRKK